LDRGAFRGVERTRRAFWRGVVTKREAKRRKVTKREREVVNRGKAKRAEPESTPTRERETETILWILS
jgi:hypothetical protein